MCVGDDANDAVPVLALVPQAHPPSEGALAWPPVLGERLGHDDGAGALGAITLPEAASIKEIDAQRLQESDFDMVVSREDRQLALRAWVVLDLDAVVAESVAQRDGLPEADRFDAGLGSQALRKLPEEAGDFAPILDFGGRHRDARREDLLGVESGIHGSQCLKGPVHEAGSYQKNQRDRHLPDHQAAT